MLEVRTTRRLEEIETVLCHAAQHHDLRVLAVTHLGKLLSPDVRAGQDVFVFTVCHSQLYTALLAADSRLSAFLPCRIAAREEGEDVVLESVKPREFCHLIGRDDLERLTAPLETLLKEVMDEVARPAAMATAQMKQSWGLGATEGQMNVRGALPHRVDCHGTQIEDLAGTGKLDSPGG